MIKVFFKTYGCQANVADSADLMAYLQEFGCDTAGKEGEADLILVNTCAIREKAEQKVFSYLGQLIDLKKKRPFLRIGVIGCIASYRKKEFYSRFDHVNFVFGAKEELKVLKDYLLDVVEGVASAKQLYHSKPSSFYSFVGQDRDIEKVVQKNARSKKIRFALSKPLSSQKQTKEMKRTYLNIMTGCNNYCSYCIVPFTRGREKSYSMESMLQKIRQEVQAGSKEINLTGQNVNSYRDPETGANFADLLSKIAKIEGQFWVRYVSPHPKDTNAELIDVMAENKDKICGYIHLPLQSGSNNILKAMRRVYTVEHYLDIIEMIRQKLPHATISTDIIVGFPGESEEDYQKTREVIEKVRFDMIYSFIYSKRKYTRAYDMEDDCQHDVKLKRLMDLQSRGKEIYFENNSKLVGRALKCLVEQRLSCGKLLARTEGNIRVEFDGDDKLIGNFVEIIVEIAGNANIKGRLA